jgi:hypothetical protein
MENNLHQVFLNFSRRKKITRLLLLPLNFSKRKKITYFCCLSTFWEERKKTYFCCVNKWMLSNPNAPWRLSNAAAKLILEFDWRGGTSTFSKSQLVTASTLKLLNFLSSGTSRRVCESTVTTSFDSLKAFVKTFSIETVTLQSSTLWGQATLATLYVPQTWWNESWANLKWN